MKYLNYPGKKGQKKTVCCKEFEKAFRAMKDRVFKEYEVIKHSDPLHGLGPKSIMPLGKSNIDNTAAIENGIITDVMPGRLSFKHEGACNLDHSHEIALLERVLRMSLGPKPDGDQPPGTVPCVKTVSIEGDYRRPPGPPPEPCVELCIEHPADVKKPVALGPKYIITK